MYRLLCSCHVESLIPAVRFFCKEKSSFLHAGYFLRRTQEEIIFIPKVGRRADRPCGTGLTLPKFAGLQGDSDFPYFCSSFWGGLNAIANSVTPQSITMPAVSSITRIPSRSLRTPPNGANRIFEKIVPRMALRD